MPEREALVIKAGIPAATLKTDGATTVFAYLPEYLIADHPPVATTLPKIGQPVVTNGGAAPAYFSGLLPEGRRLAAVASRIKASLDNDLALLIELGKDPVGDVQVVADNRQPEIMKLPIDTSSLSFSELRDRWFGSSAGSIPGIQDKVSSKMLNARAKRALLEYIVKFNPPEVPFAVENEYFFLGLAKSAGLRVSKFELLTDRNGEHALMLERFDRAIVDGTLVRLAMEDGAQVMNLYPAAKYDVDYLHLAQNLLEHVASRSAAALDLFRQLTFAWLTGNGDAHAKNFAILQTYSGEWRLSPAYDLLCTAFFGDRTMALPLSGNDSSWTRRALLELASEIGLPQKLAERELDKLLLKLSNLPNQILHGALPYRRDQINEVVKLLKKRASSLA